MLKEKVALITGCATGLGKRIAIELAKQGCHCVINYHTSKEAAEGLCEHLENTYHIKTACIQADITQPAQCERLVQETLQHFDSIDILINNAGPYIHERKKLVDYKASEWQYLINGNLNSVFYLAKEIIPLMRKNHWGRMINFGFDRAESASGWLCRSAFASAKVGLVSLTKTLAMEEAANGITVNMVCPGDIIGDMKELDIHTSRERFDHNTPIGRSGTGEDIARIVAFLCHEDSDFITGSVISATGGKDVLTKHKD
ncbi:SDR family oxidoreductase [Bacillus timonensis]|nr:SDR family oxidoreductase [Bacillus timonensis]